MSPFQFEPCRVAPTEKGSKKGCSAINEVVTQEYSVSVYKLILGVGFKKHTPQHSKEIQNCATKEMHVDTSLHKAVGAKQIKDVPYLIHEQSSRKCSEDEDSPNELYTLATYVPVTTCRNQQSG